MLIKGLGLASPPDLLPDGYASILRNVRPDLFGSLTTRQPLKQIVVPTTGSPLLTLRRLNDPTDAHYGRFATDAAGNLLLSKDAGAFHTLDTGFSGNPTMMVPFRPLQSPEPWLYISDSAKMRKAHLEPGNGVSYLTGIIPPNQAPSISLGLANYVSPVLTLTSGGTAGANAPFNRINTTISQIIYDSGSTGWCSIVLAVMDLGVEPGVPVVINGTEIVLINQVFPISSATTIAGIAYDSGTTGLCSVVLTAPTQEIIAGSVVKLNAELVRILSVTIGQDGIPAFRCLTIGTHAAGEAVTGFASIRAYTAINHAPGETVVNVSARTTIAAGIGYLTDAIAIDFSKAGNRPITHADHLWTSVMFDLPTNLIQGRIELDISDGTFTKDYFYYPFTQSELNVNGQTLDADGNPITLGQSVWTQIFINLAQLIRVGTDETKSLANVVAVRYQFNVSAVTVVTVSTIYVGGTYGPDSSPSPDAGGGSLGTQYLASYRWRASTIGSRSNPSPATRAGVFPARQQIVVSGFQAATDPQVDTIDVFIFGGFNNEWTLAASIPAAQASVSIDLTNIAQRVSELLQFDNFVPFPTPDLPRSGTLNVTGTSVVWVSGDTFNTRWTAGSSIIINSVVYTLYAAPTDNHHLEIVESAGQQAGVAFKLPEATLQGTPLPYTCDGGAQNSNVIFAAGDPLNPGYLYWGNPNDPDTASDTHNLEVTSPSEPLFTPFVWNGQGYVYSSNRLFVISPASPVPGSTQRVNFAVQEVPGAVGLFSPWFACVGKIPYFGTKNGIVAWGGGEPSSITDDSLYPLFPQAGVPGTLTYIYYPVDMTAVSDLQLSWADDALWFCYKDAAASPRIMRYDFAHGGGWFPYDLEDVSPCHCIYEEEGGELESVIAGGNDGAIYRFDPTGTEVIGSRIRTAALDFGDSRSQKLFTDVMVDLAIPQLAGHPAPVGQVFFDNFSASAPVASVVSAQRTQIPLPVAGNSLNLYRNIALDLQWFGLGTVYEFQPAAEMQPYLSVSYINQAKDHGFTTYGYLREGRLAIISADVVTLKVVVDGKVVTLFTAPSTAGNYRKLYFPTPPVKGKLMLYKAESPTPFSLYPEETEVSAREWGAGGPFTQYKPFVGMTDG